MKYIRTIGDVLLQDINNDKYYTWMLTEPTTYDIISEADTIEELCDVFVVWEGKRLLTIIEYENAHMKHIKEMANRLTVYGAICTYKGLIYVAKMNEKGELELL